MKGYLYTPGSRPGFAGDALAHLTNPAHCLVTTPQHEVAHIVMATLWADCAEQLDKQRLGERGYACSTSDVRRACPNPAKPHTT
jgi:hypothetical protein